MTKIRRFVTFGGAALIIALTVGLAFWCIWPTPYRSITLPAGTPRYLAAREHRLTGRVELLTRMGWQPVTPPVTTPVAAPHAIDSLRRMAEDPRDSSLDSLVATRRVVSP